MPGRCGSGSQAGPNFGISQYRDSTDINGLCTAAGSSTDLTETFKIHHATEIPELTTQICLSQSSQGPILVSAMHGRLYSSRRYSAAPWILQDMTRLIS